MMRAFTYFFVVAVAYLWRNNIGMLQLMLRISIILNGKIAIIVSLFLFQTL